MLIGLTGDGARSFPFLAGDDDAAGCGDTAADGTQVAERLAEGIESRRDWRWSLGGKFLVYQEM
jgi:hypothetical protein